MSKMLISEKKEMLKGMCSVDNKKSLVMVLSAIMVFVALVIWISWGNSALQINTYTVKSSRLPKAFDSFRILQVSDLHNAEFGSNNEKLLSEIKKAEPDIIVITGDIVDSRKTDVEIAIAFAGKAVKIAPCYYVTGNHESRISDHDYLIAGIEKVGVTVLRDEKVLLERDGEKIFVAGLDDPYFKTDYLFEKESENTEVRLKRLGKDSEFTVLLSHRPELFEVYCENNIDLVFSGHAHGGQFRLPVIGGLYAPHQGVLPEYDSGMFEKDGTTMIVSRGIGNSVFPFRLNNRPELIVTVLQEEK